MGKHCNPYISSWMDVQIGRSGVFHQLRQQVAEKKGGRARILDNKHDRDDLFLCCSSQPSLDLAHPTFAGLSILVGKHCNPYISSWMDVQIGRSGVFHQLRKQVAEKKGGRARIPIYIYIYIRIKTYIIHHFLCRSCQDDTVAHLALSQVHSGELLESPVPQQENVDGLRCKMGTCGSQGTTKQVHQVSM